VSRDSGQLYKYSLPHISLEFQQSIKPKIVSLALSCDSGQFSAIDHLGFFGIYNLTEDKNGTLIYFQ
jgi:hypothetical protein